MSNLHAQPSNDAKGRHIRVVENDDALRAAIAFSLKAKGFSVESYALGSVAASDAGPCDCLVIDFDITDMDGLDLLKQLRDAGNCHRREPQPSRAPARRSNAGQHGSKTASGR
jgi:CheY-like chemotaxis protein